MPLYEYYCADCHDKFETLRTMSKADASIQCKHCESMKTSRMLSLFAAHTSDPGPKTINRVQMGGGGCCGGACACGH